MKILLVEPSYKNKYPPLGLMKIAAFHRDRGDFVRFVKGLNRQISDEIWDRIYITTLFSFYWSETIAAIKYYEFSVKDPQNLFIGGPMATILADDIENETGFKVVKGLLNVKGKLRTVNDDIIDEIVPDYSILNDIDYKYPAHDAYFAYMTRGCIRKCPFCAVPKIEPDYLNFISIRNQIESIDNSYGKNTNLILMDNNVLGSDKFEMIIDEIKSLGFQKGSTYVPDNQFEICCNRLKLHPYDEVTKQKIIDIILNFTTVRLVRYVEVLNKFNNIVERYQLCLNTSDDFAERLLLAKHELSPIIDKYRNKANKQRLVDFNQGIDARLITDSNMKKLAEINIKPLRIAYDHINLTDVYSNAVMLAAKHGITHLSNYILFNYNDKPDEFYYRLENNIKLNSQYGVKIFSFPMKYIPVTDKNRRDYVGVHWNKRYIRSIQSVLNVTKGSVSPGESFFYKAFGKNIEEFHKIMLMPESYIIQRFASEDAGLTAMWWDEYMSLSDEVKTVVTKMILDNNVNISRDKMPGLDRKAMKFLRHYDKLD
jgi:hypothetical protein